MKWLKRIVDRKPEVSETAANSRIFSADGPARRLQKPAVRRVAEPDPIFGDTGALALKDESIEEPSNPYDTSSWKLDHEKGLRRVDDDKTVRRDRGRSNPTNPYDTGAFRKGW